MLSPGTGKVMLLQRVVTAYKQALLEKALSETNLGNP
jgi:hypothetical protein